MEPTPQELPPAAALRLRLAQDAARLGYWDYDVRTSRVHWDDATASLFGISLSDFEGDLDGFRSRCHPDDLQRVQAVLAATGPGQPLEISYRAVLPDGSLRHLLSRGQAITGPDGEVERLVGVVLDISDLVGAVEREQEAAQRLAGLASVALALAGAHTVDELTHVVIERGAAVLGADGGAVCVRDDERRVIRVAVTDSLGPEVQLEYAEVPLDGPLPGSYTARTGEAVFLSDREAGLAFAPEMEAVYEAVGRDAWAVLPLRSGERLLGSLAVSWTAARQFADDDRELLGAFAAQTAQALERIEALDAERRLGREARRLAETLQRSLLTSPPQPEGLEVAVRYAAAAQEAAVGGDWYDAFVVPDGALSLVIGDCVGHDRQAAAAMATMRNMLRATAFTVAEPPALVLAALDRALLGLDVGVLATALLARVERADTGRRFVWSSAGHLPPVLRRPDGTTELLASPPGLLLGLSEIAERADGSVELPPGSTVLLFTDGLVERRGEDIDVGLERLRALVERIGEQPLEELCDAVLGELIDAESDDDVALLALRLDDARADSPSGAHSSGLSSPTSAPTEEVRVPASGLVERSTALPAEPRSASVARRFVSGLIAEAGRDSWREPAELAVSEIVTNAILHAHTPLVLTARVEPARLRVEVRDENPALPSMRRYDEEATTGRGMALVAAVTSEHGVTPVRPSGKVVWFTVADDVAEQPASLDAWADDAWPEPAAPPPPADPDGARVVVLQALPPTLWLAARQHHDALLRELALHRAGNSAADDDLAAADRARTTISDAVTRAIAVARDEGRARRPLPDGHPAPLEAVPLSIDLELAVPVEKASDFAALQDVLDEAERLAVADLLLVRPGLPEIIAVRDWACEQVIAQLGGIAPSPWPGTDAEGFTTLVHDDSPLDWDPDAVATSEVGVIAADDANRIVAVSPPLAELLGWPVEELVGRRVVAIVPKRFREAHVAGFTRHLTTGEANVLGVELQLPVLRADGGEVRCQFFIEATGTPSGRTVYLAWITPLPA